MATTIHTIMKADLVLVISPEAPLMKQLGKVLGKMVTPYDFSSIERGEKYITILIHWNESARETEAVAADLFEKIRTARDIKINNETIKFIQPLYDLQDIGTDVFGICEMVIEAAVIYAKR